MGSDSTKKYKISHFIMLSKYGREECYFTDKIQLLSGGVKFTCSDTGKEYTLFGSLVVKEL
jgi:hypothetical protein